MQHFSVIVWALRELWGLKTIWVSDRLKLWKKSINLYAAFLAFTDKERPTAQLYKAMVCAVLSAIYDYESDWDYNDHKGNIFVKLLEKYVDSPKTRALATQLFARDTGHQLSLDGLERGGVALVFYRAVINSSWMRGYSRKKIYALGCKLQILDDVLDLRSDRLRVHKNCLLMRPREIEKFAAKAMEFLRSKFFSRLVDNSAVYQKLKNKALKLLAGFESEGEVSFSQLFHTGRPMSGGVYAFALTIVGFRMMGSAPWLVQILTGLVFSGLTMSIMCFNAWKDREYDCKKFRYFANRHPKQLLKYWFGLSGTTALGLGALFCLEPSTALFCGLMWLLGIFYSFIPHWFVVQNIVVAVCAASPTLCVAIYHRHITYLVSVTFLLFCALIWIDEIYLDTEDQEIDRESGYKITLPAKWGHFLTFGHLLGWFILVPVAFTLHPNPWVRRLSFISLPIMAAKQGMVLFHPEQILALLSAVRWTLKILIIVLLIT